MGKEIEILVVDDSEKDCMLLSMQLARHGYDQHLVAVHDPLEALEVLDGRSDHSVATDALLLLDIGLPKMNGLDLAHQIRMRPQWKGARIIMLTGSGQPDHVRAAREEGVLGYVLKDRLRDVLDQPDSALCQALSRSDRSAS